MASELPEVHQRRPLPTKDEIATIVSREQLGAMLTEVELQRSRIEVDLEFRTDEAADGDWEHRARGALTAHRIAEVNLRKRIHRLVTGLDKAPDVTATKELTKATNRQAHEVAAQAAAQRKLLAAEEAKVQAVRGARKLIERTSFLHHFHQVAHVLLSADDCSRIADAAYARCQAEMKQAIQELIEA